MKSLIYILFSIIIAFASCSIQKKAGKYHEVDSKEEVDSIISIATKIEGDWKNAKQSSNSGQEFHFPGVDKLEIRNWRSIHTGGLLNQLEISGAASEWSNNDTKLSMHILEFQASVKYYNQGYGLILRNDTLENFIGIKKLNERILEFENGQIFERL
ncbi:hypothetical protein GTQ34_08335 [Muricauda sp. JGD-17]|uniref:Uncharacterized protein n=1 Tax=Flagellimonas ochracea TaxID=2696472 RepID=A0A964TDD0_9FLAO|nr:hypothetical protein [Allomuricauda ochracea]NAY91923.1 hypothetical protein [Allomuricauda ochracea]